MNEFLVVVGEACLGLQLALDSSGSPDEIRDRISSASKGFAARGLPSKLDSISSMVGRPVVPNSEQHVLRINRIRNCLVHRLGFVSEDDARDGDTLQLTWLGYDVVAVGPDGSQRVELPYMVGEGEQLHLELNSRKKEFRAGSRLTLTAQELMEISWTIFLFAEELVANVEAAADDIARAHSQGSKGLT